MCNRHACVGLKIDAGCHFRGIHISDTLDVSCTKSGSVVAPCVLCTAFSSNTLIKLVKLPKISCHAASSRTKLVRDKPSSMDAGYVPAVAVETPDTQPPLCGPRTRHRIECISLVVAGNNWCWCCRLRKDRHPADSRTFLKTFLFHCCFPRRVRPVFRCTAGPTKSASTGWRWRARSRFRSWRACW